MNNNIPLLYAIKFSKWFMLVMPIIVPFYNSNGLGMTQVFMLQAIYSISTVILEIPSGYFADAYGRKLSIVLGAVLGFLGNLMYCFSFGFEGFMIAEIIMGIGVSFISGSDSALLYDTLVARKEEDRYLRFEGFSISVGNFSEAFAGLAGGALALISLRTPFYFQAAIGFIAVPASFFLVEPQSHIKKLKVTWQDIIGVVKYSLHGHKPLRNNMLFSSFIGASTLTMAWFVQPYFSAIKLPTAWYGILWTALNACVGILAFQAYKLEKRMSVDFSNALISVIVSFGYLFLAWTQSYAGIVILFVFYLIRGYATPVLKDSMNRLTPSEMRATVLSIRSFIIRGLFSVLGPGLGYLTDKFSLGTALFVAGVVFLCLSLFSLLLLKIENNSVLSSPDSVVKKN
ncbi:MAG: MFS transporter [Bacteroidota bacterium]